MRRDYALLLAATFVSFAGDWILSAGLAYQVYVLTGSTLASAAMVSPGSCRRWRSPPSPASWPIDGTADAR
jgi:hypothetical protein